MRLLGAGLLIISLGGCSLFLDPSDDRGHRCDPPEGLPPGASPAAAFQAECFDDQEINDARFGRMEESDVSGFSGSGFLHATGSARDADCTVEPTATCGASLRYDRSLAGVGSGTYDGRGRRRHELDLARGRPRLAFFMSHRGRGFSGTGATSRSTSPSRPRHWSSRAASSACASTPSRWSASPLQYLLK